MKDADLASVDFGEVTFALPAQEFGITCSLTDEEALPVVTEVALRIIHTCDSVRPRQLQEFLGFTDVEIAAVIRTLLDERLVQWQDDSLEVTPYARAKFVESVDSIPRFFRIREFSRDVVFDLMSFMPAHENSDRLRRSFLMVELTPRNAEKESRTKFWAEQSFQENFHRINRGKRAQIYKISDVEPGERFLIPLSCRFGIRVDSGIQIARSLSDTNFDNRLEISEAISESIGGTASADNSAFHQFVELFDDEVMRRYLRNDEMDIVSYIDDVHITQRVNSSEDIVPIIGSLHLPHNKRKLIDAISRLNLTAPVETFWIAPQARFWSRSRYVRTLVRDLTNALSGRSENSVTDDDEVPQLKIFLQFGAVHDVEFSKIYAESLPNVFASSAAVVGGRLELLMIPGQLVCPMFHFQIEESPLSIPIGIISMKPNHLESAAALIRTLVNGEGCTVYKLDKQAKRTPIKMDDLGAVVKQG